MTDFTGTAGSDVLTGTSGADTIDGLEGSDTIYGEAGNDQIDGGGGGDVIEDGAGDDLAHDGAGDDYFRSTDGGSDILYGDAGADTFHFSRGDSGSVEVVQVFGGADDDTLTYQNYNAGRLVANMGTGNDVIRLWTVQNQGAILTLGAGQDTLELLDILRIAAVGPIVVTDFATGDAGDRLEWDSYLNGALTNWDGSINPFAADYLQLIQNGTDTLLQIDRDGGANSFATLITFKNTTASAFTTFNLDGFANLGPRYGTLANDRLVDDAFDNRIYGVGGDDFLAGRDGDDLLDGGDGNDRIIGGDGADQLIGGAGNDLVDGGVGADIMLGGFGDDIYTVDTSSDVVTETTGQGTDLIRSLGADIMLSNDSEVENVVMVKGNANIAGNDLDNRLTGSGGANVIDGGLGNDALRGGAGADTLIGGAGNDNLFGDAGKDVMTGGEGVDRFFFTMLSDSSVGPAFADVITDFSQADHDLIQLNLIDAIVGGDDDAFAFIGNTTFSQTAGELRYSFAGGNTLVQVDVDGDGYADMTVVLTGEIALTTGDFIL